VSAALSLFLQVLPLAIGAAISPTFLAMQMVVLTSGAPGALARGWALAAGSMSMLLLISFGGLSLLAQLPDFQTGQPSPAQAAILALGGIALLVAALVIRRRPVTHKDSMLKRVVDASPPVLFIISAVRLAINATTLALYIPALHVITNSTVSPAGKASAFLMLFVITELAVVAPVVAVTVLGERAKPFLGRVHEAIERRSRVLTLATCAGFGVVLLALAARIAIQVA
jgi:Sap, sulfolipid-1-addressing protein